MYERNVQVNSKKTKFNYQSTCNGVCLFFFADFVKNQIIFHYDVTKWRKVWNLKCVNSSKNMSLKRWSVNVLDALKYVCRLVLHQLISFSSSDSTKSKVVIKWRVHRVVYISVMFVEKRSMVTIISLITNVVHYPIKVTNFIMKKPFKHIKMLKMNIFDFIPKLMIWCFVMIRLLIWQNQPVRVHRRRTTTIDLIFHWHSVIFLSLALLFSFLVISTFFFLYIFMK